MTAARALTRGVLFFAVAASPAFGQTYLWPEAESGTISSPLRIDTASLASGGAFIQVTPGNNSTAAAPTSGQASYAFSVPTSGTYKVWGRVIAPTTSDDSFWV